MSKKPKRSRHRIPTLTITSDPITPEYQAEVDASMERLRRRYEKAQKALADAEARAERAAVHAENLARKQAEAERVAANRLAEEQRLTEYIERIKQAAKESRVAAARDELERQRDDAMRRRAEAITRRQVEAKQNREREVLLAQSRSNHASLTELSAERRRELREIELLMMPGNYAGRNHRGRSAQHFTDYVRGDGRD
ncbi:Uncharacterised protein [Mycobacteroides abscessus subsp. abscessus]|uniref:hypothetical protein n=2 Tax=Mycobacteroides abscessus TaxID=36809 RepID=UPI00092B496A|nr:hypothetical protein [Mycobacteroides abscessus]SHU20739.1 Uncharacterised protein [Mycobacteroides abscessus subsp. abscessus]SHU81604.1 Uncharacterised protein [Mycobacteroides abscessus subsp. abscessus]